MTRNNQKEDSGTCCIRGRYGRPLAGRPAGVEVGDGVALDELLVVLLHQQVSRVDVHGQVYRAPPPP